MLGILFSLSTTPPHPHAKPLIEFCWLYLFCIFYIDCVSHRIASVQFSSVAHLCPTLCDSMGCIVWQVTIHKVEKSRTRQKWLSTHARQIHTYVQRGAIWHSLSREVTGGAAALMGRVQARQKQPKLKWPLIAGSLKFAAGHPGKGQDLMMPVPVGCPWQS